MTEEEYYKAFIKYCPECGKTLQQNPIREWDYACFLHGDFKLGSKGEIVWNRTHNLIQR